LAENLDAEIRLDRAATLSRAWGQQELEDQVLSEKAGLFYQWGKYEEGLALEQGADPAAVEAEVARILSGKF
jgi:hypothetical protein